MPLPPDVSFVIPVYNKADVLADVVSALAAQTLDATVEYIFVDDASDDGSRAVLERHSRRLPRVTILRNARNAGPSIRVNQGAEVARGRYLCLIDADELIVPDAVATMLRLMRENSAEMAHGKVIPSDQPAAAVTPLPLDPSPEYAVLEPPLARILERRGLVRMCWLVETDLFHAAGGCDPRVFIQDESLPLRLGATATRMIDLRAGTIYAPAVASRLLSDRAQQHHDRFFAYYNFLRDRPDLPAGLREAMARRCLSAVWKAVRGKTLDDDLLATLRYYAYAKTGLVEISDRTLDHFATAFAMARGIRRCAVQEPSRAAAAR